MLHFSRWQTAAILGVTAFLCLAAVPNMLSAGSLGHLPAWAQQTIRLGMDLRDGSHVVLAVDADYIRRERVQDLRGEVRQIFREARIGYTRLVVRHDGIDVRVPDPSDRSRMVARLTERQHLPSRNASLYSMFFPDYVKLLPDPKGRPVLTVSRHAHVPPPALHITSDGEMISLRLNQAAMDEPIAMARQRAMKIVELRTQLVLTSATIRAEGADRIVFDATDPDALDRLNSLHF